MVGIKNCKRCGRIYEINTDTEYCFDCIQKDEKDFSRIKEYLYLHPYAKIFEVSINLDISINKIKRYLREGRMEIVEKDNQFLKCELCGCSICSGLYCDECGRKTSQNFKSVYMGSDPLRAPHKVNYLQKKKSPAKKHY
ncbi:MAG: flagellar protein [Clostridia bacterium]|nr:flagellar protein [Clostridia bacterium]